MMEPPLQRLRGPVVVDLAGTALTEQERERLRHPLVGGVILFARNYANRVQLRRLCAAIHGVRSPPLLIAVDHEGGRVQRFRAGFAAIEPMRRLGELWDQDPLAACARATAIGHIIGSELLGCGVDLSFTPVLDLDHQRSAVIGDRALHSDRARLPCWHVRCFAACSMRGWRTAASTFPVMGGRTLIRTTNCPRTDAAKT